MQAVPFPRPSRIGAPEHATPSAPARRRRCRRRSHRRRPRARRLRPRRHLRDRLRDAVRRRRRAHGHRFTALRRRPREQGRHPSLRLRPRGRPPRRRRGRRPGGPPRRQARRRGPRRAPVRHRGRRRGDRRARAQAGLRRRQTTTASAATTASARRRSSRARTRPRTRPSEPRKVYPSFARGFLNRVWRIGGEADGYEAGVLSMTIGKVFSLPRRWRKFGRGLVDSDARVLVAPSVKVFDGRKAVPERREAEILADADRVRVQGKLLPAAKWLEDEDGEPSDHPRQARLRDALGPAPGRQVPPEPARQRVALGRVVLREARPHRRVHRRVRVALADHRAVDRRAGAGREPAPDPDPDEQGPEPLRVVVLVRVGHGADALGHRRLVDADVPADGLERRHRVTLEVVEQLDVDRLRRVALLEPVELAAVVAVREVAVALGRLGVPAPGLVGHAAGELGLDGLGERALLAHAPLPVPVVRVGAVDRVAQEHHEPRVRQEVGHAGDRRAAQHVRRRRLADRRLVAGRREAGAVPVDVVGPVGPVEERELLLGRQPDLGVVAQVRRHRRRAGLHRADDQEVREAASRPPAERYGVVPPCDCCCSRSLTRSSSSWTSFCTPSTACWASSPPPPDLLRELADLVLEVLDVALQLGDLVLGRAVVDARVELGDLLLEVVDALGARGGAPVAARVAGVDQRVRGDAERDRGEHADEHHRRAKRIDAGRAPRRARGPARRRARACGARAAAAGGRGGWGHRVRCSSRGSMAGRSGSVPGDEEDRRVHPPRGVRADPHRPARARLPVALGERGEGLGAPEGHHRALPRRGVVNYLRPKLNL